MTSIITPNTAANIVRQATHINISKVPQYLANLIRAVGNPALTNVVTGTAPALTLTAAYNGNNFSTPANGAAFTLPAATGSGATFRFQVGVALGSGKSVTIATAPTTDVFQGVIFGARVDTGNVVLAFASASNSNKISLVQSTGNGGVSPGEWVEVEDIAAGVWEAKGFLTSTGAAFATPFSHV